MRTRAHVAAAMVVAAAAGVFAQGAATPRLGQTGPLPLGWHARLDDASMKVADGAVKAEKDALTFSTGPVAGIYWKSDMKAEKDFVLTASFSQLETSERSESYGLFVGGTDLDKDTRRYVTFMIRQDGKFRIESRDGTAVRPIVDWREAASMKEPKGVKTSNTLQIRAIGTGVQFFVNDKQAYRMPRSQVGDGNAGLRINRNIDVQVSKLELKKP